MRRAILWLHRNGGYVLGALVLFVALTAIAGCITAAALDYPVTLRAFFRAAGIGDSVALGAALLWYGVSTGVSTGWGAAVEWAKSPPRVKPLPPEFCKIDAPADEFLIAAKREVEAIAPEES